MIHHERDGINHKKIIFVNLLYSVLNLEHQIVQ